MSVDFVVNCFERTYRDVLAPGAMESLAAEQRFAFDEITLLINNVDDRREAALLADHAVQRGAITRYFWVEDRLPEALTMTGVPARRLGRLIHYSDHCLVAVCLPGPEHLVWWDADVRLREPHDWITPSLTALSERRSVLVANPCWSDSQTAVRDALFVQDGFAIGYGFSDQVFLARRADLARPVYRRFAPASLRYPLPVFEQWVDAYMRRDRRLRATYLAMSYLHPSEGASWPSLTRRQRVHRWVAHRIVLRLAQRIPHPAFRYINLT